MNAFISKKSLRILIACIVIIVLRFALQSTNNFDLVPGYYKITKFVDGDTIEVDMNGILEKVRFIGVDTPETHKPNTPEQCFGRLASDYTKNKFKNGMVRLEADAVSGNRDRYGRLLRYVYTTENTLLNKELIAEGYGFAMRSFNHSKRAEFIDIETIARNQNRGLWQACRVELKGYYHTNDVGT